MIRCMNFSNVFLPSLLRLDMSAGTCCLKKLLLPTVKNCKFVSEPNLLAIVPVSLLLSRSSKTRVSRFEIALGIGPVKLLRSLLYSSFYLDFGYVLVIYITEDTF